MTAKRQTQAFDQTPETTNREQLAPRPPALPSVEHIQHELASATNLNDFFGKDGSFARLFATTIEQMLEAELTAHIGYPPYAAEGRNSGNSRNGKRTRSLRTSAGDTSITLPRDRNGTFQSPLLEPHQSYQTCRRGQIALCHLHLRRQSGRCRVAHAHARSEKLLNDLPANKAGRAGNEYVHGSIPLDEL